MNSKQSVFGIVAVILLAFGMGGCSSANLTKQADINAAVDALNKDWRNS